MTTPCSRCDAYETKVALLERELADIRASHDGKYVEDLRRQRDDLRGSYEHRTLVMGAAIQRAEAAEADRDKWKSTAEAALADVDKATGIISGLLISDEPLTDEERAYGEQVGARLMAEVAAAEEAVKKGDG